MHFIETDVPVLEPEDGLILGNGDLSVSIYQTSDLLIWRFGKVDVWDRRLDLDACPEPAHIDELARGIREEGWVSHEFVYGEGEATKGEAKDPKRMKEVCNGWPAYAFRPYPCPKPVGELAMHLPWKPHCFGPNCGLTAVSDRACQGDRSFLGRQIFFGTALESNVCREGQISRTA